MENVTNINHYEIVRRDWRKVIVIGLLIVLVGLIITIIQPFMYRASVSIYIMQKSSFSIDAYSASKSEERIANKLSPIILSSSFLEKVIYSGFDIDQSYFPKDEYKRREKWGKTVETSVVGEASKLEVHVYHQDPGQALQISNAIAYILTQQKREFIGIDDVDLKVLDSPLVSKYPVRPNVVLNLLLSLFAGLALGVAFVIMTYDPRQDKLFGIHGDSETEPHLVEYEDVPVDESVEDDLEEVEDVPEIEDLDDVEELAEIEESEDKAVEQEELQVEELELPDIGEQLEEEQELEEEFGEDGEDMHIESADSDMSPPDIPDNDEDSEANVSEKGSNLPKFSEEDEYIGMPDLDK